MIYRCADCKRALKEPALRIGELHFGPVCAQRYVIRKAGKRVQLFERQRSTAVDPAQLALEFA